MNLAPNGKPSNLTPEQYKLVRTPEFKAWFGDWENNPENASKVVDENGEPKVSYHGSSGFYDGTMKGWRTKFTKFSTKRLIFATNNYKVAEHFGEVGEYFVNIKNPFILNDNSHSWERLNENELIEKLGEFDFIQFVNEYFNEEFSDIDEYWQSEYDSEPTMIDIDSFGEYLKKNFNYDGIIAYGIEETPAHIEADDYISFEPNQIKLADGTNTTFDGNNPDIRFEYGGEVNKKLILDFVNQIETYQSNHYGTYNRDNLVNSYLKLPASFKEKIKPKITNNLYRGADGFTSSKSAISFTKNKEYANFFGVYTIPFNTIKNYDGLIDTKRLGNELGKLRIDNEIGDDEGEVIVLNPVFKEELLKNIEEYRNYANGGSTLLAPNGKPSNLTPEQYKNVPDEFLGNQAGGVLIICSRTNKVLLLKRSPYVQEPETWGMISGKIDAGETIEEAIAREVKEETGWKIDNLIPSYVFKKNDFTFYNFISVVDIEFTPTLDWENTDYGWFDLDNLPDNLHFGVEILLLKENIKDLQVLENKKAQYFKEGGYVKSKKVYVSINLPYNWEKENEKDIMKSFYRYEDKPFQELQEHKLVGVIGVSKSRENIADWLIFRDCLIVMNYDDFMQLNDATEIEYDNPEQLMANDLELFNRLYGNKREENEEEFNTKSHRRNNLSKILQSFPFEFKIAGKVENDNQLKNELYRIEYFTNQNETRKFMGWLEKNQYIINSPQEFADLIIKYHYSDESKSEISSFYGNTDNLKITSEYIYPIVYKALIKAGSTYTDEQEIIINNRVLNIPDDSQLFFVKKEKSNQDELIEKYKLKDTYRVAFVKQENIDRFRGQIDKKRTENFNQKRESNLKELEEKSKAILPLLLQEIKLNISEYYYSKAKNLFDKDNYYKDYEGDDTKYYSVEDIPEVKQLLRGALDVIEGVFKETFYSSDVKEIDKYKFSNFTWLANEKLKEYINSVDNTLSDEIFKYHTENNDTIYANELTWTLRELFDYGESPVKELNKVALAQRYVEWMGGDMFRYYSEKELNLFKKGGKTIAQTPAPKKERIYGSEKNPEGSSKDIKSAKSIELSEKTIQSIKNKVDEHNSKYPKKKINLSSAKAVVRRGMGAYSSSHRPTIKGGKPNSRVAWGLARLNAFIYKIVNGKSKSGKYNQDDDLIKELGYKVKKYSEGGSAETKYQFRDIGGGIVYYKKENGGLWQFIEKDEFDANANENNIEIFKEMNNSELQKGIKVEMEHKDTILKIMSGKYSVEQCAEMIAKDHLKENDKYYTHLAEMERKFDDGGQTYGTSYSEEGFNLMQKHLEEILKKYGFKYYVKNPKAKQVKYIVKGTDIHTSITMYRNYDNNFGRFYVYLYSERLKPKSTFTQTVKDKNNLDVLLKKVAEISNLITPEQQDLKNHIDNLKNKLEDILYMYGDSDSEMKEAMNTSRFKDLERRIEILESEYNKKFSEGGQTPAQQEKIAKVMGEFKRGELNTSYGTKVTDDKQAIAIALSEAGVEKKEEGGVIEGQLHTECNDDSGCGEKFDVGGVGNIIEAERDEAVIVSSAFSDTNRYKIKGTPSQIASALNVMGGGKNFDGGAIIDFNGKIIDTNNIRKETNDTDVKNDIESGSVIINRRSMYDNTIYEVEGTPKQIASAINSVNGYGVVIENGATIKEA